MENSTKTLGMNKKVVNLFHKILLIAMLHNTFVAPSQNMLNAYFNYKGQIMHYKGNSLPMLKQVNLGSPTINLSNSTKNNSIEVSKNKSNSVLNKNTFDADLNYLSDVKEGIIGVTKEIPLDNPSDNLFKFNVGDLPNNYDKVILKYDLFGLQDDSGVSRSINNHSAIGGHIIKTQMVWTTQIEELNADWLEKGENKILFTTPKEATYSYRIKNLSVSVQKGSPDAVNPRLVINKKQIIFKKNETIYVKGFVRTNSDDDIKITIDDIPVTVNQGEFEGLISLSKINPTKKFIVVKANDNNGLIGQELISFDNLIEADAIYKFENNSIATISNFKAYKQGNVSIDGASINIGDSCLTTDKNISLKQLRYVDIAPISSGIINVTKGGKAFRFLPDGTKFNKSVKINIEYDSVLLPKGTNPKDIKTFFFNTKSKNWVEVRTDSINTQTRVVSSYTNHFTDYINGIIQVPESPNTAGFTSTMMNDIKAADPALEMTLISPPEASQKGDANISYPIKIPSGRKGMQPQIAVQYSNNGGNGWLGLGWNISTPAITIDTRWGTPTFDTINESEIYSLGGEQLMYPQYNDSDWMPNRHRDITLSTGETGYDTTPMAREYATISNIKNFTIRKQGSFAKIERLGVNPTNYYWKVTNADGSINWFGGNKDGILENSIIRQTPGANSNIVHWGLYMTEDVFGNNIIYQYLNTSMVGNGNLEGGKIFNIDSIHYTGKNGSTGNYYVNFKNEITVRTDVNINARLGVKQIEPYRLESIAVGYGTELIRTYRFDYIYGRFQKSLLNQATEFDANNKEFYNHKFDYYDDLVGEKNVLFEKNPYTVSIPNDQAQFTFEMGNLLSASRINANETIQTEWGVRPAGGIDLFWVSNDPAEIFTIGAPFGESNSKSKGKITLKDMDGNGLDDVVYKVDNALKYFPHFIDTSGNNYFGTSKNINNINDFYRTNGWTKTMFGESWDISFLWDGYFGTKRYKSSEDTNIYFTDGNGDGLPDIVNDDKVYFNTLDPTTGDITYDTSSKTTPNMLITANTKTINATLFPSEYDESGSNEYDVVRVWEAPRNGIISIEDSVEFLQILSTDKATYSIETNIGTLTKPCQPFRIYLKQFDNLNTDDTFQFTNYYGNNPPLGYPTVSDCNPQVNSFGMNVFEGQKFYFRLHKNRNSKNEILKTNPVIHYLSGYNSPYPNNYLDENNVNLDNISYNDSFILSDSQDGIVPNTGHYSINWDSINISQLSDDVTFKIVRIETIPNEATIFTTIYEKFCPQYSSTTVDPNTNSLPDDVTNIDYNSIISGHKFYYRFYVNSDSNVRWKEILWKPILTYIPDANAVSQSVPNIVSEKYIIPQYDIYRAKNNEFLNINTTISYPIWSPPTGTQTYSILPKFEQTTNAENLLSSSDTGEFLFIVKKDGFTIGKIKVSIISGIISLLNVNEQTIPITFDANMYDVNNLSYEFVINSSNAELFRKYNHDITNGIASNNFGYKNVILGYGSITYNSGVLFPSSTKSNYMDCYSTTLFKKNPILGPMYRGWGQFIYNSDIDSNTSIPHDLHGKLINDNVVNGDYLTGVANVLGIDLSTCESTDPAVTEACTINTINTTLNLPPSGNINSSNISQIVTALQVKLLGTTPPLATILKMRGFRIKEKRSKDNQNGEVIEPLEKWLGLYDSQYTSDSQMKDGDFGSSHLGNFLAGNETDSQLLPGNTFTGMNAITKNHKSVARSWTGGWGATNFSHSESSYSVTTADFMDLNGDKYPDVFSNESLQSTNMTGGHKAQINHSWSDLTTSENYNDALTTNMKDVVAGIKEVAALSKSANSTAEMNKSQSKFGTISNMVGISANLEGTDKEDYFWSDLNGDGLPDRIKENGGGNYSYQLNLGKNTNSELYENFNYLDGSESIPNTLSANISVPFQFNLGDVPFNISAGFSKNAGNSIVTFQDINSDGLTDILEVPTDGNSTNIRFNTGNSFSSMQNETFNTNQNLNENYSLSLSGSVSDFWGFDICCWIFPLIYLKFGATLSGGANLTVSDVNKSYSDFNGDGYTDYIESNGTDIKVYPSLIRRTNMLRKVNNPLKGDFIIDYEPSAVTYECPNAKWVMKSVVISDNFNLQNDGEDQYSKNFTYENAYYDRRERESYGFEIVKTIDKNSDGTFYRTSVAKYHNQSYFLNGLMKESYVVKGEDINDAPKYIRTQNLYQIKKLDNTNNALAIPQVNCPLNFDVGGTEGRKTAAVVLVSTINEKYELNTSLQITSQNEMEYDQKGRIKTFINHGDLATPNDNYTSEISYHSTPPLITANIISVPKKIVVIANGSTVRERRTVVNNNGTISKVMAIFNNDTADTNLEYDIYGNLSTITLPGIINTQRMVYKYSYDLDQHKYITKISDSFGYNTESKYNAKFDKIELTTDITGNKMRYSYDSFGRTSFIIAPKESVLNKEYTIKFEYFPKFSDLKGSFYDGCVEKEYFMPVAVTNHFDQQHVGNDIQTITFIDGLGRPIQVKKDIEYNAGTAKQPYLTEAMSVSGKEEYDFFGRAIRQYHPYFEGKDCSNMQINESDTSFVSLPSETVLDELDRTIQTLDPEGHIATNEYSLDTDNQGNIAIKTTTVVDQGTDNVISETYKNINGKVISTKNVGPDGDIWTNFTYNNISELMSYIDAEGHTTKYTYDMLGRKTSVNHPDNGLTSFEYDIANNLITLQTANLAVNSQFIKYFYNLNRLENVIYPQNPDGSENISNVTYKYGNSENQTGRLIYQSDATGSQTFAYGNMGEMTKNTRVVEAPNIPTKIFTTNFEYDSWNRLQQLIYPDGEKVSYKYNLGGSLVNMVNGDNYEYIKRIDYDYYEQRQYLLYGNNTESFYNYSPTLRRMTGLHVKTHDGQDLFDNVYDFDNVGNVISIINNAVPNNTNLMGGTYNHSFNYDNLNRLKIASGNFEGNSSQLTYGNDTSSKYSTIMRYNNMNNIINKKQEHVKNEETFYPNSYNSDYKYNSDNHQLIGIYDNNTSDVEEFKYDNNGNIIQKNQTDNALGSTTQNNYLWDESNRLRVIVQDEKYTQNYFYDAGGERVLKASADYTAVFENGQLQAPANLTINAYTEYPSAYMVITPDGQYSKHYYSGTQRIVSRIGDKKNSIFDLPDTSNPESRKLQQVQKQDVQKYLDKAKIKVTFKENERPSDPCIHITIEECCKRFPERCPQEPKIEKIYYFHPDHLGTTTFLTDANGDCYQIEDSSNSAENKNFMR